MGRPPNAHVRLTAEQQTLASQYVPLAQYLANCFARHSRKGKFEYDDLLGVAFLSLVIAVGRYDPRQSPARIFFARQIRFDLADHMNRERRRDVLRDACHPLFDDYAWIDPKPIAEDVEYALSRIPIEARDVFRLHYLDGLPLIRIARKLGWSLYSVRHLVIRTHAHAQVGLT